MDHPQVIHKLVLQEQEPSRSIDCLGLIGQHPRSDMVDASQPLGSVFPAQQTLRRNEPDGASARRCGAQFPFRSRVSSPRQIDGRIPVEEAHWDKIEPVQLQGEDWPILRTGHVMEARGVPKHDVGVLDVPI